jgi:hypothetical protein
MDERYPLGDDLVRLLQDLRRRVSHLERSPRLSNASIVDPSNVERVRLGLLDDDTYGLQVFDENGDTAFKASGVGLTDPGINLPIHQVQAPITVTSGSFVGTWETSLGVVTHDSIVWTSLIATDVGTTAQAELRVLPDVSAAKSIPSGNGASSTWRWKPPLVIAKYTAGPVVQLWVRRTGGAGNVYAYPPQALYLGNGDDVGATASGV